MMNQNMKHISENIDETLFTFADYDQSAGEAIGYSNYSYWQSTIQVFFKNKVAVFLLILIVLLLAFTFIQPLLPNQKLPTKIYNDPATNMQYRNVTPNSEFWFGTNSIGQDLWSRIWSGTRTSLIIGFMVGLFEVVVGIVIGAIWGYMRKLDRVITEVYNVWNNIPTTIVLILLTYIMRPGIFTLIFAMSITSWLGMTLLVRNLIVILRDREYNLASRCLGTPINRIISKNLVPYLVSVIMLRMALAIPTAIGLEVFLTYIGLGLPVDIPSLGNLVNEGRMLMMSASLRYQLFFPAIVISLITIAFYVMGNAFADAADPRNHV
ncbi:ABC transporter permease [Fusibacter sp. 3D3]|uniref:ABC transporter permease n=1 Tax=Fusibacter sp. 3D3 TaxID=1048380 RepID=UPI000853E592|nr:ABC transporter permease [Fusibacter sp. 3D3]GAU77814.1 oligopeptide transport system permease protein OppC [Fusibacter sp. 3D3]